MGHKTKRREVVRARHVEVIASRSELLSLHCPQHLLFLALLPACDSPATVCRLSCVRTAWLMLQGPCVLWAC